jgi:hypothetical protein
MLPTKEELVLAIDEALWSWLRAHLERGGLILVDDSLDLADTALKLTNDDSEAVEQLITVGKIGKPTLSQVRAWNADPQKRFAMLIVSPFVLIQERMPVFH